MILTINTGSSSVRLNLFTTQSGEITQFLSATLYRLDGQAEAALREFLKDLDLETVLIVAHRVVHGGGIALPQVVNDALAHTIQQWAPLAPLHNPRALEWIRAARAVFGTATPQIAVFDTAFFAALPKVARDYALPPALTEQHAIRRYGFHGLAHQAMWQCWAQGGATSPRTQGRVITLQLGSGCSVAAIANGVALDTSMGFSPLEGLMMATRCGDVDPGVLLCLQRAGLRAADLEVLLSHESGLLGVSELSSDMRVLLESDSAQAAHAIDLYCYRARKYIGAYLAVLGGADAIIFGGGVGEHAPEIRARILQGLDWAGIALDAARNEVALGGPTRIDSGAAEVWVCAVDEAEVLAKEAEAWMQAQA